MKEKKINKKRLLTCAAAAILLAITLFFFGIAISAEEYKGYEAEMTTESYDDVSEENPAEIPEWESQNQSNEGQNQSNEGGGSDGTIEEENENQPTEGENQPTEGKSPGEIIMSSDNIFEDIYRMLESNADKIFSILAFIGTIIVGVGYKSGLLPLLRDAISKLKGSIDRVKEDNDTNNRTTGEKIKDITTAITEINETLTKNTEEIARIEWQFDGYEEMCREREAMRVVLEGQIDMLYAIFMSSALPQYQKDEIGGKISQMREELSSYGIEKK